MIVPARETEAENELVRVTLGEASEERETVISVRGQYLAPFARSYDPYVPLAKGGPEDE
jgi:hypothetical protein